MGNSTNIVSSGATRLGPVALFVLATAMSSVAATATAFAVVTAVGTADEGPLCACTCESPTPEVVTEVVTIPVPIPPAASDLDVTAPPVEDVEESRPQRKVPRVRQASPTVTGTLDRDIIRRIVRAHINEVRHCYNQALVRDLATKGRVGVRFTIGASGRVQTATAKTSSTGDEKLDTCVVDAVERWRFPKPKGGGEVVVTYPFVLTPG